MTIHRLRQKHNDSTLAEMYATPHDHRIYGLGHHVRVEMTIALAQSFIPPAARRSVGDYSCGNGVIAKRIAKDGVRLGDFAPGYPVQGPLEDTLDRLPPVDVYVCSETLEHLNDPAAVLLQIKNRGVERLLLSTPIDNWGDSNAEHYWAWDRAGVESLLSDACWLPRVHVAVDTRPFGDPYCYGLWVCR